MLCWFAYGGGRRYAGFVVLVLGALLMAVDAADYCGSDDPDAVRFALIAAMGACVGYLGYRVQRRTPAKPPLDRLLATRAEPVPSTRTVRPEDVLGSWQFYVDDVTRTVTIDLQADHRYAQALVSNSGERIDGPGGTWKLDGPFLELSSYRSAACGVTECIRWFFGDLGKDWVLFAKDKPHGESMLLGLRHEVGAVS